MPLHAIILARSGEAQVEFDGARVCVTGAGRDEPVTWEWFLSAVTKHGWEPLVDADEARRYFGHADTVHRLAEWDESKHPRGQPENAGEFGPGGGSAKKKRKADATKRHPKDDRIPGFGQAIKRAWRGTEYEIEVQDHGFFVAKGPENVVGRTFPSLTAAAKAITGANAINGVAWFGLGKKKIGPAAVQRVRVEPPGGKAPTPSGITASFDDIPNWSDAVADKGQFDRDAAHIDAYRKAFKHPFEEYRDATENGEIMAHHYVGSGYTEWNSGLRDGWGGDDDARDAAMDFQSFVTKSAPTKFDMVLYRGDTITLAGEPGSEHTLKGFTSASTNPTMAPVFTNMAAPVFYEISVPAGSRGVLMGINDAEQEAVMMHGARFRLVHTRTEHVKSIGRTTIQRLEYIGA